MLYCSLFMAVSSTGWAQGYFQPQGYQQQPVQQMRYATSAPCGPRPCYQNGPGGCVEAPDQSTTATDDGSSLETSGQMPQFSDVDSSGQDQMQPSSDAYASSFGAASGYSGAPGMVGDSYTRGSNVVFADAMLTGEQTEFSLPSFGRYKFADNSSPIPQNRIFFNYNHFHNALQTDTNDGMLAQQGSGSVDSFVLGFEKTLLLIPNTSIEMRIPFFSGSANTNPQAIPFASESPDVGSLSIILKTLLFSGYGSVVSAGVGFDLPTASKVQGTAAIGGVGVPFLYENEAIYLNAFASMLYSPNGYWWLQGVGQYSTVLNNGNSLTLPVGIDFTEQDLLYTTLNGGLWFYWNPSETWLQGIASILELNYTHSLDDPSASNTVTNAGVNSTLFAGDISVLNLSTALHFQFGNSSELRVAVVVPIRPDDVNTYAKTDRFFDAEVAVQFNKNF